MELFHDFCHEGVMSGIGIFLFLFENHLDSLPDCQNALWSVAALYYVYIVVEVTMNIGKYAAWSQQPKKVNFEPIIRGLESDIFD